MDRPVVALVLAGGTGTRLYPASRGDRPKQFQAFGGDRSLLARTVDRAAFADEVVVLTRESFADRIPEHAPDAAVLVEPAPKDTGPALVYAARWARDRYGECVLLCLPSDHHVAGDFESVAGTALSTAVETGGLVTIGIEPDRPATGYGYIEPGEWNDEYAPVERFREKPGAAAAASLVDSGCLWNAGIFAWTPTALLEAARDSPLAPLVDAGDAERALKDIEAISIDYAVLERTADAYVVTGGFEWDDLGAWDAVGRLADGPLCESVELDTDGTVIAGDDDVHVTAIGVSDLVIAAYDDRVLVVPHDEAQRVKEAVEVLRDEGRF